MKKYLPYVFPAIAFAIVLFLLFRWYKLNDQREGQVSQFGEGVEIQNLSDSELSDSRNGVGDFKSVEMESTAEDMMGTVRYEISDEKVKFTVMATLPEPDAGRYQVWLREVEGEGVLPAFTLEESKGGYLGSAALDADFLPFEVVVSRELVSDNTIEETLLTATLEAEAMEIAE